MNEPFSDELLSAYLDGELTPDDRIRVEDWLTESAEHRRLLDDLKALRRELQALPKQSLDAGFSDRVLATIRQRAGQSSSSPPATCGSSPASDASQTIPVKPVSLSNKQLGMPAWRWFAGGVAATLLAVIAGMNAAPQTMAQLGRLAQIVQPTEGRQTREGIADKLTEPSRERHVISSVPGEEAPVTLEETPSQGAGSTRRQREPSAIAEATNKATREIVADNTAMPKEAVPDERAAEPQLETPAPRAPSLAGADAAVAPGAAADSFAKDQGGIDGRGNLANETKKSGAPGIANGQASLAYDEVIELPVTGEQADRALAFYARTVGQQAAHRYSDALTLAVSSADEKEPDQFADSNDRETVLRRSAAGKSLMKLMDAATEGVEIAALDVTGPEAEVQALLDSLGVEQARDLRPTDESFRAAAGGIHVLRANREGEDAAQGSKPAAATAAAGKEVAKADGALEKAEIAKEGGPAPTSASRGGGAGGFPTVTMRSVRQENQVARDQAKRSLGSKQEGLDAPQPQLRVRLVFVPADRSDRAND